jgi:ubiquinone/menaquinone biosynthesis C-methylase UbiE
MSDFKPTFTISTGTGLLRQCRQPAGWLGRLVVRMMNRSHSKLTQWGLGHVAVGASDVILDIGCGGGKTIARLAALAHDGKIYGVDYSDASVRVSREKNRDLVAAGRVEVVHGSVSALPFPEAMFDIVTAIETHYYWPDLTRDLCEVLRVLKPGGTLMLCVEMYRKGKHDHLLKDLDRQRILHFTVLSVEEHRQLLAGAGFSDVEVFEERRRGWLCATGRKPVISRGV